jgi:hypothetical protein
VSAERKLLNDQQFLREDGVGPGALEDVQDEPRESDLRGQRFGALGPMKADIVEKR